MTAAKFFKQYGVSVAAAAVLCGGIVWGIATVSTWLDNSRSNYSELHEFIHQSDDIPFQDGQLSEAQIKARDDAVDPVQGPEGAVDWKTLSKAQLKFTAKNGKQIPTPFFTKEILALDNTVLEAKGYIFPLDQSGKQAHFLLSPYPPSCPYCLPAGPSELIEVTMKKEIPFTYDTILVRGTFETIRDDRIKQGMLYALHDAQAVK